MTPTPLTDGEIYSLCQLEGFNPIKAQDWFIDLCHMIQSARDSHWEKMISMNAVAEPVEPYAWELFFENGNSNGFTTDVGEAAEFGENKQPLYAAPIVFATGDPKAWLHKDGHVQINFDGLSKRHVDEYTTNKDWTPLYIISQVKKQLNPLSNDKVREIYGRDLMDYRDGDYMRFARAIEAAHGIGVRK